MLSLYTKIPMPWIEWNRENTKYVLTLLPLSGFLTGALEAVWFTVSLLAGFHAPLYAAVACGLPLLLHGGIHLDGLADTADAGASYASAEKRRAILADPHLGAFGAAAIVLYELLTFGVLCEIFVLVNPQDMRSFLSLLMAAYVLPMMLTQLAAAVIPPAVPEGMLYSLTSVSDRRLNVVTAAAVAVLCFIVIVTARGISVVVFAAAAAAVFLYFRNLARKRFGGISGDLCGWLIKVSEVVMLAALLVSLKWF